jgi:RHS repeat-associated protein
MTTVTHAETRLRGAGLILIAFTLASATLRAQVGNDNPTGPAGQFNGNITTGCSYDPLTGNAVRSIVDLAVTGGVGNYPLVFSRVANSRLPQAGDFGFGDAGGWRHSYAWDIDGSEESSSNSNFHPTVYPVTFPDGRQIFFTASSSDTYFRGPPGVPERFQPLDLTSMKAYLLLADGGKVEFLATRVPVCIPEVLPHCTYTYTYQAQAIIDPHGITTTLSYNHADGSLIEVQEQAGRSIQLFYTDTPWLNSNLAHDRVIDHIQASDGRVVTYHYWQAAFSPGTTYYTYLGNVVYPFEPALNSSPTAFYAYQAPNGPYPNGYPLLLSCDDPMYAGPMKKITYTYATGTNPDGSAVIFGQIQSENSGATGHAVSTLAVTAAGWRTETRGDGPWRALNYSDGELINYTDFKGQWSSISYDGNGYTSSFTDARHHTTYTVREGTIGALSMLTHPDPEQSNQRFSYTDVNSPYYLQVRGDERDTYSNTYFTRDPVTQRVTKIWYPDYPNGPTESFTYNGFGEVLTHTLTSGGVENFRYDGRGLKSLSWPPATASDPNPEQHPTQYFYYPSGPQMDRLWYVIDPRGNATWFEYNVRGQVTKVTHQDGTYSQSAYNPDGTLAWKADENHPGAATDPNQRTRYTYDDYKRILSVTDPLNHATSFDYRLDWVDSSVHTTSAMNAVYSPNADHPDKETHFAYDENLQRTVVREAPGTADEAWTYYGYDEVGNLAWVEDPRGNVTTFGYDERNRRISATAPAPFTNQITQWAYDTRSNLTRETRPDQFFRRLEYDSLSRVIDTYGFANEHTHYDRDLAGNVHSMTDPRNEPYTFAYDVLNRKTSMIYPDSTHEDFSYDPTGNQATFKNRAGNVQTFQYDTRNRQTRFDWNDGVTVPQVLTYDAASNITDIYNANAEMVFTYYDDNRLKSQEEWTNNFGDHHHRTVSYAYDPEGNRATMQYPTGRKFSFNYTQRGQLSSGYEITSPGTPFQFLYEYDASGNRNLRGVNGSETFNWANESLTTYTSDALNRFTSVQHYFTGNSQRFQYDYDVVSRRKYELRDWSGLGDGFQYDAIGQVTGYQREGVVDTGTGSVSGGTNRDTLNYDANGNRTSVVDNSVTTTYQAANSLNEYPAVGSAAATYDLKGNLKTYDGWTYGYDAQNRLTSAVKGSSVSYFWYDGLNRVCTWQVNGDITFNVWDGWNLVEEYKSNNILDKSYLYGAATDELVSMTRAGQTYYFYQNGQGSTSLVTSASGQGLETYKYDLAGKVSIYDGAGSTARTSSAYNNRFLFTGREYFQELGLYNYRNRFYHPGLGRFLQSDPSGFAAGDNNLYRYCGGDPVNRSDPSGLAPSGGSPGAPIKPLEPTTWDLGISHDPNAPFSTQGFWSTLSGLPTGTFALLADRIARAHGFEGYDPQTGAPIYRAEPVLLDGLQVARAEPVSIPNVEVGQPIGILDSPDSGFAEAYNLTGKGWVYGWQGTTGYSPFGAEGGYQVVILQNGQQGFFFYAGAGAGVGTPGYAYYEGVVNDVHWLSDYRGGFVSLSSNFVVGGSYSLSPDNGASTSGIVYGTPGASMNVERFWLSSVWWGR